MVGYKLSNNDWVTPFFVIFRSVREILLVTVFLEHPVYIPETLYFQSTHIMYHKCLEVHPEDQGQVMWELGIDCCSDLFSLQSIGEPPSLMSDNLINELNPTCVIWLTSIWCQTCVIVIQSELEVYVCVFVCYKQGVFLTAPRPPPSSWRLNRPPAKLSSG